MKKLIKCRKCGNRLTGYYYVPVNLRGLTLTFRYSNYRPWVVKNTQKKNIIYLPLKFVGKRVDVIV